MMKDDIKFRLWEMPKYGEDYLYSKKLYRVIVMNMEGDERVLIWAYDEAGNKLEEINYMHPKVNVIFSDPLNFYVTGFVSVKGKLVYTRSRFVTDEFAQKHKLENKGDKFKDLNL